MPFQNPARQVDGSVVDNWSQSVPLARHANVIANASFQPVVTTLTHGPLIRASATVTGSHWFTEIGESLGRCGRGVRPDADSCNGATFQVVAGQRPDLLPQLNAGLCN